jgi:hypothetical protein
MGRIEMDDGLNFEQGVFISAQSVEEDDKDHERRRIFRVARHGLWRLRGKSRHAQGEETCESIEVDAEIDALTKDLAAKRRETLALTEAVAAAEESAKQSERTIDEVVASLSDLQAAVATLEAEQVEKASRVRVALGQTTQLKEQLRRAEPGFAAHPPVGTSYGFLPNGTGSTPVAVVPINAPSVLRVGQTSTPMAAAATVTRIVSPPPIQGLMSSGSVQVLGSPAAPRSPPFAGSSHNISKTFLGTGGGSFAVPPAAAHAYGTVNPSTGTPVRAWQRAPVVSVVKAASPRPL